MAIKNLIKEIESDVIDLVDTGFEYVETKNVPSYEDSVLTFEQGVFKKGKRIKTTVLYADIRDSVSLTKKYHSQTMGRFYTAFSKGVIKAAHYHGGFVRNIIGDRVMIVFPSDNCFTNAVDCATTINHIIHKVISKKFGKNDFKCGIGIDYGELKVIKVGIPKQGSERTENKGLVWVGYPANIASRLTDVANKTITEEYFSVTYKPLYFPSIFSPIRGLGSLLYHKSSIFDSHDPIYLPETTVEMTPEVFARHITNYKDGVLNFTGGEYIKHEKKSRDINYSPILITAEVFSGYKKETPNSKIVSEKYFKELSHQIDNVKSKVWGADIHWVIK